MNCQSRAPLSPRIRGEYAEKVDYPKLLSGSPPLTRGIQSNCLESCAAFGFTPAYAGNADVDKGTKAMR